MKKNALFRDLRLLYKISLVVSHSIIIRIFLTFLFAWKYLIKMKNNQDIFLQLPPKKTTSHDVTFCNTGDYLAHLS